VFVNVRELVADQYGLITREQALECGLSQSAVGRRLESREWLSVLPGVYRHSAVPLGNELMLRAAMLWLGADATVSGIWAAWWHGLCSEPIGPVTVTVPRSSGARSRRFIRVRRRNLSRADIVRVRGLDCVTRALAVLESAREPDGLDIRDRALQLRLSPRQLEQAMARFRGAAGARAARESVIVSADGTVSPPERELRQALRRAGITALRPGVEVVIENCPLWLDFESVELKLAVEIDGVRAHTEIGQFHKDRERQNLLVTDRWTVLRYTPKQIRINIERVLAEIEGMIAMLSDTDSDPG
jgi:very-short-patch-repair endonuclease